MKITILGSGTFLPDTSRHCSSYLFEVGENKLIFDFGRGAINSLIQKKIDLKEIRHVFISHLHADHFSEISSFLAWLIDEPSLLQVEHRVIIYGPVGLKDAVGKLLDAFQISSKLPRRPAGRIEIVEINSGETAAVCGLLIQGLEVDHSQGRDDFKALSFRITHDTKIVCYSGDTPLCEGIRAAVRDADLAIVEATLPKEKRVDTHMNGEDLGVLAKEENIKKLIVTHIDKSYLGRVEEDIRKNYPGELLIAQDLMEIVV